jgi:hypothetical protein
VAFRLIPNEPIGDEIARVLREQIDAAITEVTDAAQSHKERIHGARLRCKRIRAVLALIATRDPVFFARENASFRDAARSLSAWRDAEIILVCFDRLLERQRSEHPPEKFESVRRLLIEHRRRHLADAKVIQQQLREFAARLRRAQKRLATWKLEGTDLKLILPGFRDTYRAARRGLDRAYATEKSFDFHEWRKAVKRHDYHCRLLRDAWPALMLAWHEELAVLAGWLGDEHDLSQLREFLHSRGRAKKDAAFHAVIGFIDHRCDDLRNEAEPLGRRLFAEKPKDLVNRLALWWRVAHEVPEGDETDA